MKIETYKLEKKFSRINLSDQTSVWFGDPCYVVPGWNDSRDIWSELCDEMFKPVTRQNPDTGEVYTSRESSFDERNNVRVVDIKTSLVGYSGKFYMWSTNYGDGSYPLTYRHEKIAELGVDAGCLSLIPMSVINDWGKTAEALTLGKVVDVFRDADLVIEDGDMYWGDYNILTGYESQEDDWDVEEECMESML